MQMRRWWSAPLAVLTLLLPLAVADAPQQSSEPLGSLVNQSNSSLLGAGDSLDKVQHDLLQATSGNLSQVVESSGDLKGLVLLLVSKVDEQALELRHEQQRVTTLTGALLALSEELRSVQEGTNRSIDTGWLLYSTSLVMFMQLGFALVEAGSVRKKSYRHVFLKNLLDFSVGMSLWFLLGYWIAFPDKWEGDLFTFQKFDLFFNAEEASLFAFQTMFSSTSITIVSGAMAERTRMEAYLTFCALCGGMLHSVVVRWTWGGGWLSEMDVPYHDFAGSGIVHATGGVAAFVGAWLVGPRAGRWADESTLHEDDRYKPHSPDGILMGTLILWFGWFGFNPGSTTSLVGDAASTASVAYVNTMIAPTFSAVTIMLLGAIEHSKYSGPKEKRPALFDLGKICNGVLGGLVCVTAGCDVIPPEWSAVVGVVAGFAVKSWSTAMKCLRVDDPVDAVAVHGFCGVLGVLCVGLFHKEQGLLLGGETSLLVSQLKGIGAIIGYVGGTSFVYFYVVHAFGLLRMNMVVEVMGVDYYEFKDGAHDDFTDVEVLALQEYRTSILNTLQGDIWGLELDVAIAYAKTHRRVTVFFLCVAMFYNYFYYAHFEWRGWTFFSVVNLAVGLQCAAASHCEFKCPSASLELMVFAGIVVLVGVGLSICNFAISPADNLPMAWVRTLTLSFAWSVWMHLRMQPVDWETVCMTNWNVGDNDNQDCITICWVYLGSLFPRHNAKGCWGYIASLFMVGRIQHIFESALTYASVTSDLWVGLDEFRMVFNDEGGSIAMGFLLVSLSSLQMGSVISRLFVPYHRRSIRFFQGILLLTSVSEIPIAFIVYFKSESDMRWIALVFSAGSVALQSFNLMIATVMQRHKKRKSIRMRTPPAEASLPRTSLQQAMVPMPSTWSRSSSSGSPRVALNEEPSDVRPAARMLAPSTGTPKSASSSITFAGISSDGVVVAGGPAVDGEGELPSSKPVAPDHVLERLGALQARPLATMPRLATQPPPPQPPPLRALPPAIERRLRKAAATEPRMPVTISHSAGLLAMAQTPRAPEKVVPVLAASLSGRGIKAQNEPFGTPRPTSR